MNFWLHGAFAQAHPAFIDEANKNRSFFANIPSLKKGRFKIIVFYCAHPRRERARFSMTRHHENPIALMDSYNNEEVRLPLDHLPVLILCAVTSTAEDPFKSLAQLYHRLVLVMKYTKADLTEKKVIELIREMVNSDDELVMHTQQS